MEARRRPVLLVLALLALTLAGCRLRATVEIRLDRDGAGQLEIALAADAALMRAATAGGADPLAELERRVRELDAGGWRTASRATENGGRVLSFSAAFAGPEAFERLIDEFTAALAAPELAPLGPFTLALEEDRLRLEGWASLAPGDAVRELGLEPADAVAALDRSVDYRVRVSLPGEALEHDASQADGAVLEWVVPAGQRIDVRAVGARPADRTMLLLLGGLLATLITALALRRMPTPQPVPVAETDEA